MRICSRALPNTGRIQEIEAVQKRPIMFYRPEQPKGASYLKVSAAGQEERGAASIFHECNHG